MKYSKGDWRRIICSRRGIAILLAAVCACGAATAVADSNPPTTQETAPPDYSAYKQSYHMPFGNLKPVDFNHLGSLSARVSINGGPPMRFQIDTGSDGLIVGATDVPNVEPKGVPGNIVYVSSGNELDGVWTDVTVTFPDAKDDHGNVATAKVPVLIVTQSQFHPGAVNGGNRKASTKPGLKPRVYMLGIGSGRGKEAHQERNPWVNLNEMRAGTMRRGYIIGRDGVTFGLTPDTVGKDYLFEKLTEHVGVPTTMPAEQPVAKDWNSSQGWITVGGEKPVLAGMLLDTGLTNLMIEVPEAASQTDVPAGTDITVALLSGRLQYSFKVGEKGNPAAPRRVTWVIRPDIRLINTGLNVLALYDYLYDADGGYLGLRPIPKKP